MIFFSALFLVFGLGLAFKCLHTLPGDIRRFRQTDEWAERVGQLVVWLIAAAFLAGCLNYIYTLLRPIFQYF